LLNVSGLFRGQLFLCVPVFALLRGC